MVKITSESKSSAGWGQICETDLIAAEPDLVLIQIASAWISSSTDQQLLSAVIPPDPDQFGPAHI